MRIANWPFSIRDNPLKICLLLFVVCAATAVSSPAQTLTTIYKFCSQTRCADGALPEAGLVQGIDGNFYGTTVAGGGGSNCDGVGCGAIFKISTAGVLTVLYGFNFRDGYQPYSGLVLATDGNFYGTTASGGSEDLGTAFKITPSGALTQLYSFCSQGDCLDGASPYAALVQGADGNFYGTTATYGNANCMGFYDFGCGTVFKLTASGTLTTLHTFSGTDGVSPYAGLILGNDGNFYGTTLGGGANNDCLRVGGLGCGSAFKITPSGTLSTLYSFCSLPFCADGYLPYAGLVQAMNGNFYGTNYYDDTQTSAGTVYGITPAGGLITSQTFNLTNGANPVAGLIQATDGNFYGTTYEGGANNAGTVFKWTPGGSVVALYNFCSQSDCADGANPYGPLVQATDGNLYGMTADGGNDCPLGLCGTVFKLSLGLSPFVTTVPSSGAAGTPVTILGTNLAGATSVTFNGTPATIISNTGTAITTTVPAGATTGTVQVTTPSGTLNSNKQFQVIVIEPLQFVPVTPCRLVDTHA